MKKSQKRKTLNFLDKYPMPSGGMIPNCPKCKQKCIYIWFSIFEPKGRYYCDSCKEGWDFKTEKPFKR